MVRMEGLGSTDVSRDSGSVPSLSVCPILPHFRLRYWPPCIFFALFDCISTACSLVFSENTISLLFILFNACIALKFCHLTHLFGPKGLYPCLGFTIHYINPLRPLYYFRSDLARHSRSLCFWRDTYNLWHRGSPEWSYIGRNCRKSHGNPAICG